MAGTRFGVEPLDERWADRLVERLTRLRHLGQYGSSELARPVAQKLVERLAPQSRLLVLDGAGYAWLATEGRDLGVLDVVVDDAGLVPKMRAEVERLARADDALGLVCRVAPGEESQRAFVAHGGFEVVATQLRLGFPWVGAAARRTGTRLEPMTDAEFDMFMDGQVEDYAGEREQAGEPPDVALATATRQFAELLPDGVRSPGQHLFTARDEDEQVGTLWVSTERPEAFVYDVIVQPEHRRKGYGEAIMVAAAQWAEERGAIALGLNVFGHNTGARALYDRLGFVVTEENHRMALP